jgi:hypothetical protein
MRACFVPLGVQRSASKRSGVASSESPVILENTDSLGLQPRLLSRYIQTTDAFCALSGRRHS